ncbi:hypothetical protein YOLOSWAG_228 [Erwinia phage vB_EamM_Yoloswag]|uniref:Uncharacterized protein n=1 Tax=Erwinia phage vB_EamM_Yoloswag TaxID=1958956 RepID=A0A1S6L3F7_9CAUD|nr:hypothetical protein HOR66_gp228 [Erwinia phage vB_EamM_Yoloswag]AQT28706.1 hypothetical protein YOLOSWAG_228 [Erwinia phage vB_EamM_Yoloswag]
MNALQRDVHEFDDPQNPAWVPYAIRTLSEHRKYMFAKHVIELIHAVEMLGAKGKPISPMNPRVFEKDGEFLLTVAFKALWATHAYRNDQQFVLLGFAIERIAILLADNGVSKSDCERFRKLHLGI